MTCTEPVGRSLEARSARIVFDPPDVGWAYRPPSERYEEWMRALDVIVLGLLLVCFDSSRQLAAQEPARLGTSSRSMPAYLRQGLATLAGLVPRNSWAWARAWETSSTSGWSMARREGRSLRKLRTSKYSDGSRQRGVGSTTSASGPPLTATAAVTSQSGSEQEFGAFLGGYIAPMWGWRHFRIGPRVQAGAYWPRRRVPTFGIFVTPLTARLIF